MGRLRPGPEADLFARYNARLRHAIAVTEIAEGATRQREAAALLAALPADGWVVALDGGGAVLDSVQFAALLQRWTLRRGPVCFVIGGADGLDRAVIARADQVISLGAMTWPHFLVRGLLAEQVFRAQTIRDGHPYHRGC